MCQVKSSAVQYSPRPKSVGLHWPQMDPDWPTREICQISVCNFYIKLHSSWDFARFPALLLIRYCHNSTNCSKTHFNSILGKPQQPFFPVSSLLCPLYLHDGVDVARWWWNVPLLSCSRSSSSRCAHGTQTDGPAPAPPHTAPQPTTTHRHLQHPPESISPAEPLSDFCSTSEWIPGTLEIDV